MNQMKIYNLISYQGNNKTTREKTAMIGDVDVICSILEKNKMSYHEITQGENVLIIHGDLDFHEKKEDNIIIKYGDVVIREINKIYNTSLTIEDFKYTMNNGKRDKKTGEPVSSFHWSIPKISMIKYEQKYLLIHIHNNNYEELNEAGIIVNNSGGKWKGKKKDADDGVYKSDSLFRLPNQLKEGKENTEHIIINGDMKDFLTQYIEKSELKSFTEKPVEINISDLEKEKKQLEKEKNKSMKEQEKEEKIKEKEKKKEDEESTKKKTENIIYSDKKKLIEQFIEKCYTYERSTEYNSWLNFGICCKNSFEKDDAIYLWKEFSKKDMEKFEDTNFESYFEKLKINEGYEKKLTIWSLYYWAKRDNKEEYKKIIKTDFKFVNLNKLLNHTDIPKLIKEFSPNTFVWKKNIIDTKDYWTMYFFDGIKWNVGDELFKKYIGDDLHDILDQLYVQNIEDEEVKKKIESKLLILKNEEFKSGCLKASKTIFKNDDLEFDKNNYLLGFNNCIIDLKTCKARPYKYDDYVTFSTGWTLNYNMKTGDIIYDNEKRKEVEKLLKSIQPKEKERKFWLEVLSTGMDGIAYQKIFFFTGGGGNGKGTISDFLIFILGNKYSSGNIKSTLISNELRDGPNPELAKISKLRFIQIQEPVEQKKLNNATLKELTGGGKCISARACHSNNTETFLNMTMVIECNEKPLLKDKAGGSMKRRMEILEFTSSFTEDEADINNKTHFKANKKFISEEWRSDHKHEFLQILLENYNDLRERNYDFINLESSRKACESYMQKSDIVMNWFNLNYKRVNEKDDKGRIILMTLDDILIEFKLSEIYDSLSKKEKAEFTKKQFYENFKQKPYYREEQRIKRKIDGVLKTIEYTNVLLGIQKEEKKESFKVLENVEDDENCLIEDYEGE